MASGINFTPDGVPELTRALETLDKLVTSVGKLAGTGKALEELRRIIVGVGDSGSALHVLSRSVQDLAGIVRSLPVELKTALSGLKVVGSDAGKALGDGLTQGANESLKKAKTETIAGVEAIKKAVENAQRSATGTYSTLGPRPASVSPIIAKEVEAMNKEAAALESAVAKVMKAATLPGGVKSAEESASVFYAAQDAQKAAVAKWEAQLAKEAVVIDSAVAKVMKAATLPGGVKSAEESASVFYAAQDAQKAAVAKWEAQLAKEAKQLEASVSKVIKAIERPGYTHAGPTWWEKALAEQEAAQIKLSAKNAELVAKIYANNTSGPIMSGTYSDIRSQQRVTPTPEGVPESTLNGLKKFTQHANEAHSAARGLASGLGLLWLTWGSMVPLLAGAAISNATVQMIKMGAEVEHTMRLIGSLGDVGAEGVKDLNKELLKVASGGVYGPLQVAEALKAMSMAGLDAKQQIAALGSTLQFAQLGEMPTKQAAETLAAIAQAFGYSARDWSVVGDIISQTAASTTATISDMAAAFKSSSVVAQLYGVALQDTAVSLGLLNQIGIRGTAGGTAMRQMFTELIGVTTKGKKALEELGIQVMTTDKQAMLPFRDIIVNLTKALSGMNGLGQMRALQDLMNERGLKAAVAGIQGYIAEQKNLGLSSEETVLSLGKLAQQIEDAPGTMAVAAAAMATTSKNLMTGVKTALESSLVETFDALQPVLVRVALTLRKTFQSEGFKDALATLADYVSRFTTFIIDHASAIVTLMKLYVDYRVALVALVVVTKGLLVWQAVTTAWAAATGALGTLSAVVRAATISLTGFNAALTTTEILTGAILIALAAAAAHWWFFSKESKKANDERVASLAATTAISLGEMEKEYNRLGLLIAKMWEGTDSQTAQAQIKSDLVVAEIAERYKILKLTQLQIALSGQEQLAKMKAAGQQGSAVTGVELQVSGALKALENLGMQETLEISRARQIINGLKERAKEYERLASAEARLRLKKPQGNEDYAGPGKPPKSSDVPSQNLDLLAVEKAYYAQNMSELQRASTQEKAILDAKHKALLISEGQYQAQSLAQTITNEDAKVAEVARHNETSLQILETAQKTLEAQAGGTNLEEASKLEGEAYKNLDAVIKKLIPEYQKLKKERELLANQVLSDLVKIQQEKDQRKELLSIDFQGKIAAEAKAYKDLGRELDTSLQKQRDKLDLEYRMADMTEVQRAGLQAQLAYEESSAQAIAKRTEALQGLIDTQSALADLIEGKVQNGFTLQDDGLKELIAKYGAASEAVKKYTVLLQEMKDKASNGASLAQHIAEVGQARKETIKLRDDLAKALTDAAMKGGQGFKNTWLSIRDWLKNTFAKTVLEPQLKLFFGQMLGTNAAGSAAGSAGGSAGGSAVGSLLGSSTGSIGTILFGSPAAYGAAIGTTSVGAGSQAAMLAAQTADFGWAGVAATAEAAGSAAGTLISALSNAVPYAAAVTAVASLFNKKSTPHVGGYASADETGKTTLVTKESAGAGDYMYQIMKDIQPETQTAVESLAKSFSTVLNNTAKTFKLGGAYQVSSAFAADNDDNSRGLLKILKNATQVGTVKGNFNSDPTKGLTEYTAASVKEVKRLLSEMDLPAWAKKQLDGLSDSASLSDLATMSDNIDTIQLAFYDLQKTLAPMEGSLGELSTASSDTLYNLSVLAGGFGNLSAILSTYYKNYYSASEQHAASLANLTSEYTKLNMGALPQTKEAFRTVIDQFVAGGGRAQEGGEKTYLTLMQLANGFAALDSAGADTAAWTTQQAALLRAQGKELQAVTVEREAELAALRKTNPEMVLMQQYLWGLQDAAASLSAQQDLQIQIERVLGHESAAVAIERQREIETLQNTHPELVNLQKQLYGVQDAATAAAAALEFNNQASAAQDKFLTPQGKIDKGYSVAAQTLIAKGVSNKSEGDLTTILKGMSKQDIYDFAAAFVKLDGVSLETKTAVVEVAGALAEVKDQSAQLTYDLARSGLEAQIAQMSKDYGDLQAAMDLIVIPIKTMSQQYIDNASAIKTLSDSLDQLLGISKKTPQEILSDMLQVQKALKDARSSVQDAIFTAKLGGMKPGDKAAALREREASLFAQLKTDKDPAAVVSKLQSVIMERVQAEADAKAASATAQVSDAEIVARLAKMARDAQVATLQAQLDGFKKLKELAAGMGDFIAGLRSGDLSNLSYGKRLTTVKDTFASTLERARNGDPTAVGNLQPSAQDYLKQSQQFYGGASAEYSAIFESVTSSLDALAKGVNVDPQIAKLELQIDKMTAINAAIDAQTTSAADNSAAQVAALEALDAAIAARQAVDDAKIDEQIRLAKAQIDELKAEQELIRGQIVQQYDIFHNLNLTLADLTAAFNKAQSTANMESARP